MVAWDLYEWKSAFSGENETVETQHVGGLDTPTACIRVDAITKTISVTMTWRGISETSDGIDTVDCGTASKRRRVFTLQTVI